MFGKLPQTRPTRHSAEKTGNISIQQASEHFKSQLVSKISLENIRVYAHHGCLKEERTIGSEYLVGVTVNADLSIASVSDNLSDTIDYVHINHIVKEEMKIPSNLLEHVAKRIADRIFNEMPLVSKTAVVVSKINPPIGGDVEMVSVKLLFNR